MNRRLKNRGGFTLIELMLSMAMVAILATIAVPTYLGFLAKTRQGEAKENLGGVFVGEQSYKSEYNIYSESFSDVGFGLAGAAKYYDFTMVAPADWDDSSWIGLHGTPGAGPPPGATINLIKPPFANTSAFTCIAVGSIHNDDAYDVWSIDQNSALNNDYDGVLH
ncbi:MAG: prepilin-type N-terminal cleavage/methylation domain-containing protein [Nitrospirota bacterium]